jgi:hypothetical protein
VHGDQTARILSALLSIRTFFVDIPPGLRALVAVGFALTVVCGAGLRRRLRAGDARSLGPVAPPGTETGAGGLIPATAGGERGSPPAVDDNWSSLV